MLSNIVLALESSQPYCASPFAYAATLGSHCDQAIDDWHAGQWLRLHSARARTGRIYGGFLGAKSAYLKFRFGSVADQDRSVSAGADSFLEKPVHLDALRSLVKTFACPAKKSRKQTSPTHAATAD